MKKIYLILLCFVLIFPSATTFAAEQNVEEIVKDTANYIYESVPNPQVGSIGGEWAVMGLARSGADISDEYFEKYYQTAEKHIKDCEGVLHTKKYTEYSRMILALTAIGKNPKDVAGYNLLMPLEDYEKTI